MPDLVPDDVAIHGFCSAKTLVAVPLVFLRGSPRHIHNVIDAGAVIRSRARLAAKQLAAITTSQAYVRLCRLGIVVVLGAKQMGRALPKRNKGRRMGWREER